MSVGKCAYLYYKGKRLRVNFQKPPCVSVLFLYILNHFSHKTLCQTSFSFHKRNQFTVYPAPHQRKHSLHNNLAMVQVGGEADWKLFSNTYHLHVFPSIFLPPSIEFLLSQLHHSSSLLICFLLFSFFCSVFFLCTLCVLESQQCLMLFHTRLCRKD